MSDPTLNAEAAAWAALSAASATAQDPPTHALVDTPSFTLTVPVAEDDARRYATSLWLIQEQALRHMAAGDRALAPSEYKRILRDIYKEARATLGVQ